MYNVTREILDQMIASPREIYKRALVSNVHSIILAHNHPSESLEPSPADIEVADRLRSVGLLIGIPLIDNFIVSKEGYLSFVKEGLFPS